MQPLLTKLKNGFLLKWEAAFGELQRAWPWLFTPSDPIKWKAILATTATTPLLNTNGARVLAIIAVVIMLAVVVPPAWQWYSEEQVVNNTVTFPHAALINPIVAGIGAALLIYAAIKQARIASDRHGAQTKADQQRRITESFSRATDQLSSEKIEVRLGGIYTLERLSLEVIPDDDYWNYWTVMETLCAFVRERAPRKVPDSGPSLETVARFNEEAETTENRSSPPTDIAAALAVIVRRNQKGRRLEGEMGWRLDLRRTNLRFANLNRAPLKRIDFWKADLGFANLSRAYLPEATFTDANLWGVNLTMAELSRASLFGANLCRADLRGANLDGAWGLDETIGDAKTQLPDDVRRPSRWPPYRWD